MRWGVRASEEGFRAVRGVTQSRRGGHHADWHYSVVACGYLSSSSSESGPGVTRRTYIIPLFTYHKNTRRDLDGDMTSERRVADDDSVRLS